MPEKKGVGVIHIKPFSKSKNVAKIILVDDILNLMCWKCKINHLQIIFHHNDVIFIANILYDISVSALSVVNFLYIYKCNLICRSPLEKNKKRNLLVLYSIRNGWCDKLIIFMSYIICSTHAHKIITVFPDNKICVYFVTSENGI